MVKSHVLRFIFIISLLAITLVPLSGCGSSRAVLTVECQPSSGGSITPGTGEFDNDVVLNIAASPAVGYRFDHWEGSLSGTTPNVSLTMDGSKKVTAVFKKLFSLAVTVTPEGSGTVNPNKGVYDEGQNVSLIAESNPLYTFSGWTGNASGSSDHLNITMNADKQITAAFVKKGFTLQAKVGAGGGGTIEPLNGSFEAGSSVKITAYPLWGYRFNRWEGSSTSTEKTIDVTMDGDKTLTAFFTQMFNLKVNVDPAGAGIVKVNPDQKQFDQGTKVNLTAVPDFGYIFTNWSGVDNSTSESITVTMDAEKQITANYKQLSPSVKLGNGGQIVDASSLLPVIPLKAAEWLEMNITVVPASAVKILGPDSEVIIDLGTVSIKTIRLQAAKTGNYTLKIDPQPPFSISYDLTYTIYYQ